MLLQVFWPPQVGLSFDSVTVLYPCNTAELNLHHRLDVKINNHITDVQFWEDEIKCTIALHERLYVVITVQ